MMTSRHQIEPLGASLPRLVRCIRDLGLRVGWKYWRIGNRALRDPELVLAWADLCDEEAAGVLDPRLKVALQDWAQKLRVHWYLWERRAEIDDISFLVAEFYGRPSAVVAEAIIQWLGSADCSHVARDRVRSFLSANDQCPPTAK